MGLPGAPRRPLGPPWAPWAPGAPNPLLWVPINSKTCQKIYFGALLGCHKGETNLGFRPWDPHGEIRAGILCRIPVLKSQMVGWRPIWWQKGVTWGPLGFRAQPAHLAPLNPPISNPPVYPT